MCKAQTKTAETARTNKIVVKYLLIRPSTILHVNSDRYFVIRLNPTR